MPVSTIPLTSAVSGTLPLANGGTATTGAPAFSAYSNNAQSISSGVYTKVLFDTEEFDTANCFSSSRFTPTVAGYYTITTYVDIVPTGEILPVIYKNGSAYKRFTYNVSPSANFGWGGTVSSIYMNGTTDYLEYYVYQASGGTSKNTGTGIALTYFNGCMTRAA